MSGPYRTSCSCDGVEGEGERVFCPRCKDVSRLLRPWRGWKTARRAWFAVMLLILGVAPIWSFDYIVMTPTALVITLAIGPLNHFASLRPTCRRCGLAFASD